MWCCYSHSYSRCLKENPLNFPAVLRSNKLLIITMTMNTVTVAKVKPLTEIWCVNSCKWALTGNLWGCFHLSQSHSFPHTWKWFSSCCREAIRAPSARTIARCEWLFFSRAQSTVAGSKKAQRKTWSSEKKDRSTALSFNYDGVEWQACRHLVAWIKTRGGCRVPVMFHSLRVSMRAR